MIRVGIVGTNTSHAGVFAGILNGADGTAGADPDARVVGVWGSGKEGLSGLHQTAAELAETHRIDRVAADPSELIGEIDLALILDDQDGGAIHPDLAEPFLRAGLPTFVDKPMALELAKAVALFELAAQFGTPLMSCSSLRFADELKALQATELGELSLITGVGPGDWYNYGVHTVEAAVAVYSGRLDWVQQFAGADRDLTVIGDVSGPKITIGTLRDAPTPFQLSAYGSGGTAQTDVGDYRGFYTNTIRAAVGMAATGQPPIKPQDTLTVLSILAAGERSRATGRRIALADLLSEASR